MRDRIFVIIKCLCLLLVAMVLFNLIKESEKKETSVNSVSRLVVYGDNVDKKYLPLVEDNNIYISYETIEDFIDENIFRDDSSTKIIMASEDILYKFSHNSVTKNLQPVSSDKLVIFTEDNAYINSNILKEIYGIKCEYEADTETVAIDRKSDGDIHPNYNEVRLYKNIRTDSDVLDVLNTDNTVVVYTESLNHNRWYKVKSDSGKIGYVEKGAITIKTPEEIEEEKAKNAQQVDKKIMFWQYGSKLDTLGEKIEGVDVAMPTWFKVSSSDGSIEINFDKNYYNKAKANGYELYPIITNNYDSSEIDSKELSSKLLRSEASRENLIRNIVNVVTDYDLEGINIDFESIREEDKDYYTQFLRELHPIMKEKGKILTVDAFFTGYINRSAVGQVVDYFILMGYDQRGTWSKTAGSISEISWVENNVKSLIEDSKIDPQKIILGVPFYTMLWKIDSNDNLSTEALSIEQCKDILSKYNLSTTYDEQSGQNYVSYTDRGATYKLWVEDEDSIAARAELVNKYNLAGISAWQKALAPDYIWDVIKNVIK